jgi:redox-regulated HSP33 family molecular chaperone
VILKTLSPHKEAVLVTLDSRDLAQELWESRDWVNPKIFLMAVQASLASLALQGLNEEDSRQNVELQWLWDNTSLKALYADSLFQGAVRTSFSWTGQASEEVGELYGKCQLRRSEDLFENTGIIESRGNIVEDVQELLAKSEQKDCFFAVSIRWEITQNHQLKITKALAYLLHVLPTSVESHRAELTQQWADFLASMGAPADWSISENSAQSVRDMAAFIFARPNYTEIFSKKTLLFCHCNQERANKIVEMLAEDEFNESEKEVEVNCKYCGANYKVTL